MPSLSTFIQQSICSPSDNSQTKEERKEERKIEEEWKKKNPNWEGRSKTVTVLGWYDTIYRES